jgi:hypothetical protein
MMTHLVQAGPANVNIGRQFAMAKMDLINTHLHRYRLGHSRRRY